MAEDIAVFNLEGKEIERIKVDETLLGGAVDNGILHQVVVGYMAHRRRGTSSTKTRGEVSGGGRKPWRQKGTGRARTGSVRSPIFRGGGITFGPSPREYKRSIPEKLRRTALIQSIQAKIDAGELMLLDVVKPESLKTKSFVSLLKLLNVDRKKCLVSVESPDETLYRVVRNIPYVTLMPLRKLNAYEVMKHTILLCSKESFLKLSERLLKCKTPIA